MSVSIQVGKHQVTVSEEDGNFDMLCSCGQSTPANWCDHVLAVVCGDMHTISGGDVDTALEIIERRVEVIPVLTWRLDRAQKDPARQHEIPVLENAIAQRLNQQSS